ncbi:MAG: hypothetical protein ACKO4A_11000 [Gammaproteobacteria bacterium]
MDSPVELLSLSLSAAMVALSATLLLIAGLRIRMRLFARIARLEDALRVYNSANAEIGRQLRAMEERLLLVAATPLAPQAAESPAPRAAESARREDPLPVLRTLAALAPRAASAGTVPGAVSGKPIAGPASLQADQAAAGSAERRLAELIRARLPATGALQ